MEAVVFEERLRGLLRERRVGLLVLALSLFLNLFLAFSAARNREQVVLLPITGFEGRWMVSPDGVSEAYLRDFARSVALSLFTLAPTSSEEALEASLNMATPAFRPELRDRFEAELARMRKHKISAFFRVRSITTQATSLTADIEGVYTTWLASSPGIAEDRTYRMVFSLASGHLQLAALERLREDDNA